MRNELDPDHWCNGGEYGSSRPDALAMQALDDENKNLRAELERLRADRRWIPVEERLPEERTGVLVMSKTRLCAVRWHVAGFWEPMGGTITHWMPLPPVLPKEV